MFKRSYSNVFAVAALLVGCSQTHSGGSEVPRPVGFERAPNQVSPNVAGTDVLQVTDVGHSPQIVIFDSRSSVSPTNFPYDIGQRIHLRVSSPQGTLSAAQWSHDPAITTVTSYSFPSPGTMKTAAPLNATATASIVLTTSAPSPTPQPSLSPSDYEEYSYTSVGEPIFVKARFADGSTSAPAKVTIVVAQPTVSPAVANVYSFSVPPRTGPTGQELVSLAHPGSPSPYANGFVSTFTAKTGPYSSGKLEVVQTISTDCTYAFDQNRSFYYESNLPHIDTEVPYLYSGVFNTQSATFNSYNTIGANGTLAIQSADAPGTALDAFTADVHEAFPSSAPIVEVVRSFTAQTYLMYQSTKPIVPSPEPSSTDSNLWVSLGHVTWTISGTAVQTSPMIWNVETPSPGTGTYSSDDSDQTVYPMGPILGASSVIRTSSC